MLRKFTRQNQIGSKDQPKDPFDLFISFNAKDRYQTWFGKRLDIVSETKVTLERYRHPDTKKRLYVCTYDEDFELGAGVLGVIASTIDKSRAVLFLSTKRACQSPYVSFELEHTIKTKRKNDLLSALVDQQPHDNFPSIFVQGELAADLSIEGCSDLPTWRQRMVYETAKIVARIWDLPLQRVRDRFIIEQRKKRLRTIGWITTFAVIITLSITIGIWQFKKGEAGRVLSVHQRYAADIAAVQRAWTAGNVEYAKSILDSYTEGNLNPDPRSFDWATYQNVLSAEQMSLGNFAEHVTSLNVAPNYPLFAFSTEKQPITIYDANTKLPLAKLSDSTIKAHSLVFSSDGRSLWGITKGKIWIWNVQRKTESSIATSNQNFTSIQINSSNNHRLIIDEQGVVYELKGEENIPIQSSHFRRQKILRLEFSKNGKFLIIITSKGKIKVLDARTYVLLYEKNVPDTESIKYMALSDDYVLLPKGRNVVIMDLATSSNYESPPLAELMTGIAVSDDGNLIAVGNPADHSVIIWQLFRHESNSQWRQIGSVKGYEGYIDEIKFIQGSKKIVASSLAGDIKVWDISHIGRRVYREHAADIQDVTFVQGTNEIISLDKHGIIRCWNYFNQKEIWRQITGDYPFNKTVAFINKNLAISDTVIRLYRVADGKQIDSLQGWGPVSNNTTYSTFAYVDSTGENVVVECGAKKSCASFHIEPENDSVAVDIVSILLTDKNKLVLVGTADGRLFCFDLEKRIRNYKVAAHSGIVYKIAVTPDENIFATASSDKTIRLWNLSTGELINTLRGHTGSVQTLAFSPDGKTLASGAQDGLIKLWNRYAQLETATFYAHQIDLHPGVTTLKFSEDGKKLVSGGANGTLIIWESSNKK